MSGGKHTGRKERKTMTTIRRWENEEWSRTDNARTQEELTAMAKDILKYANSIDSKPTPGSSRPDLSRVYTCTSTLVANVKYIMHIDGFKVQDITEIVNE